MHSIIKLHIISVSTRKEQNQPEFQSLCNKNRKLILNPLNNPLLQDPDGVGVTGLTKGDKMVQKWILSEFTKVPFTGKKPLGISETASEVKKGSVSKKNENASNVLTERESSSSGKDDLSSNTNGNESRISKNVDLEAHKSNTELWGHIYADGKRWGLLSWIGLKAVFYGCIF
ncbi:hypothetical protein V6N13_119854 [Hibiscus sabdariffa]|uniref:Uncharacterized protein n=1 Tax=Hibiscus sabdariffa TaxID=183260 RepID=A0ABR2E2H2_9ROSI